MKNGKIVRMAMRDFTIWPMSAETRTRMREWRRLTEDMQRKTMWDQPKKQERVPEPR